jgi:ATP-binding cassette, subfamily B, bacterial
MEKRRKDLEKVNPLRYLFGMAWRYSKGNRHNVVKYWFMFVASNLVALVLSPLIMAHIFNTLQRDGVTRANIWTICGWLFSLIIIDFVFWFIHGPARIIERVNGLFVKGNYRKFLVRGVMLQPLEWHAENHSGRTIDKIEKGTSALFEFSQQSFEIIVPTLQLLICYVLLMWFSWPSAITVLVMLFGIMWITVRYDKVLEKQLRQLNTCENDVAERVSDTIANITTVVILRIEKLVFDAISTKIDRPTALFREHVGINEMKWCLVQWMSRFNTAIVLTIYFFQNIDTKAGVKIGSVFILVKYLDKITDIFFKFTGSYSKVMAHKTKVMNAEEIARDFQDQSFSNHVLPDSWETIEVSNLNFSYRSEGEPDRHLDNVSFSIRRGERIALVGKSGSGKSTLLKLIRDLYKPTSIDLVVDGHRISEGFNGINREIALIPQAPEIFATTVGDNITLGAEYPFEVIREYADMACFTEVIEKLPRGLDSRINEKGVQLSIGQRQRLALTRGLLACRDKSIILLDEPTSSIDATTELQIYRNILSGMQGKSVLCCLHGLHLLPFFDRILMFDQGKIVGSGTLEELVSSCPEFARLWSNHREQIRRAQV